VLLHLSQITTSCLIFSILTRRPKSSNSLQRALEQSVVLIPINLSGISPVIFPSSSITFTIGKECFLPISKSTGECAGVTLRAPVPNSISVVSSAITGISLFAIGRTTFFPTNWAYLLSLGFTATAVSPSIVSGRVVATVIPSTPNSSFAFFLSDSSTNG